jgi:hypothetical protein
LNENIVFLLQGVGLSFKGHLQNLDNIFLDESDFVQVVFEVLGDYFVLEKHHYELQDKR